MIKKDRSLGNLLNFFSIWAFEKVCFFNRGEKRKRVCTAVAFDYAILKESNKSL